MTTQTTTSLKAASIDAALPIDEEDDWENEDMDYISTLTSTPTTVTEEVDATEIEVSKERTLSEIEMPSTHSRAFNLNQTKRAHNRAVRRHLTRYFTERSGC